MTDREMKEAGLRGYQRALVRRLERDGFEVGPIIRVGEDFASIRISKGDYETNAGFPATKWIEKEAMAR